MTDYEDRLKTYARVQGLIVSAPLDMPRRLDDFVNRLHADGWTVVITSIGTDFANILGIPVPKTQPIDLRLHRTDHPYSWMDAQAAVIKTMAAMTWDYNPVGAWAGEVTKEVIVPSIEQAKAVAKFGLPLIAIGLAAIAAIYAMSFLPKSPRIE